jgi:endo-1,4-beta-xylanase
MTVLAVVAGVTVPLLVFHEPAAAAPLRQHATARGKFFGYAANAALLCNNTATCTSGQDATYRNLGQTEFNQVTPENVMKWENTEPNDNNFTFTAGDGIVANATANGQTVHGHTLLWHQQTPGYVTSITNATTLRTVTNDHIAQVVGRWASNPTVTSWDVVNEAFNEDGSRRGNVWQNVIGNGYIAEAFQAARAADANAQLCYNDFNIEGMNNKSNAVFAMVQQFLQQGVPINCVGFQSHFIINQIPSSLAQNIQRFVGLGLTVRITELDIRMPSPVDSTKLQQQANNYATVVNTCLANTGCTGITVWGIDDGHSWLPNSCCPEIAPLLWDAGYAQKPAYTSVHNALDNGSSDTTPPSTPGTPTASNVGTTTATLNWAASTDTGGSGLAGYNVYREQGATDPILATPTANSANLTGLTANTSYTVYIRARDNAGNLSNPSATVTFMTTGGGTGPCTATPTVQSQWQTGYVIEPFRVTNTGTTTITGWTVTVTIPTGHAVTGSWPGNITVVGQTLTARNMTWNATLAPGASATFGFQASRPNGNTALPTQFTCTSP